MCINTKQSCFKNWRNEVITALGIGYLVSARCAPLFKSNLATTLDWQNVHRGLPTLHHVMFFLWGYLRCSVYRIRPENIFIQNVLKKLLRLFLSLKRRNRYREGAAHVFCERKVGQHTRKGWTLDRQPKWQAYISRLCGTIWMTIFKLTYLGQCQGFFSCEVTQIITR